MSHTGHRSTHPGGSPAKLDFRQAPFIVIWEVTRACDLACAHCRAEAQQLRHPQELSTGEGFELIDEIRRFGRPLFIFTGGDPLKRPDIFELIQYAHSVGLKPALSPSGTPLLNREHLGRAAAAGIGTVSISLDGATAAEHDHFRGVAGSFELSTKAAHMVRELDMRLQINTTVTPHNMNQLPALAALVDGLGAARWEVFFLVPTGRGRDLERGAASQYEQAARWLFERSSQLNAHITVVEAPFYRRVTLQRLATQEGTDPATVHASSRTGRGRFLPSMNSGSGFVFVSHLGEVYPSGFMPLTTGSVRSDSLVTLYRDHPVFRQLRDPDQLKGRCGRCEYRALCGGSRARAYAMTGDYLASDPFCNYLPDGSRQVLH